MKIVKNFLLFLAVCRTQAPAKTADDDSGNVSE